MKKLIPIIALAALVIPANAFVLMGPSDPWMGPAPGGVNNQFPPYSELTLQWHNQSSGVASANVGDTLYGTPKDKFRFFRLNTPYLTYGFHESFVQYFGAEGVEAIDDAMRVINDFFIPEDGSYRGMSELDLIKHGFSGNFATWWRNQTAANQNLIDLKSLTLGIVVNRLGLGNPHRYAFTAYGVDTTTTATTFQAIFRTKLNNYDPLTLEETDRINDIQYSYRLIHDRPPGATPSVNPGDPGYVGPTVGANEGMTMDMEEFTSSIEDHTYSAVSAIQDAFYGTTDIVWTQPPSKFGFGIFYDGLNAMGGMYQPRHALTFDDAGGLKYLYSKDNVVMEYNPWQALKLADYSRVVQKYGSDLAVSSDPFVNLNAGVFPVRNAAAVIPTPTSLDPLRFFRNPTVALPGMTRPDPAGGPDIDITIRDFSAGNAFVQGVGGDTPEKIDWAFRGGIDTIQIKKMVYDSLLDTTPESMAFQWEDVFMTNLAIRASQGGIAPGTTAAVKPAPSMYFTQVVNRVVSAPDFLFLASPLDPSDAGTPTAYEEELAFRMISTNGGLGGTLRPRYHNMRGGNLVPGNYAIGGDTVIATGNGTANPQIGMPFGAAFGGPGIWAPAASSSTMQITFNNSFAMSGFEVIWSGETTVLGNTNAVTLSQQNWAHIKGPGPLDFKKFPDRVDNQAASYYREWENTIYPSTGIPAITALSDNGGVTPSLEALARTSENLTIMGNHFRNAVALEVINEQGAAVETIYPIASFVKSNNLIEVPFGVFSDKAEGDLRRIQIWTTETVSEPSDDSFTIHTGPVIITGTSHDGKAYDRNDLLTVFGQGFKSLGYTGFPTPGTGSIETDGNMTASHIRLLTSTGEAHWPSTGDDNASFGWDLSQYINVISDEKLVISGGAFPQEADGVNIFLTISRGNNPSLSAMPSLALGYITTTPQITGLYRGLTAVPDLNDINSTAPLHRDKDVTIKGFGLNTVSKIEFIRESGLSYIPSVTVLLNSLNWTASDNGTDARITANAITQSNADGFGAYRSKMKITTDMGEYIFPTPFNINRKPDTTLTIGGLTGSTTDPEIPFDGSGGYVWDYMGADRIILQNGGGMRAVKFIRIAPVTGPWELPLPTAQGGTAVVPTLAINDAPGTTPGVTVTDTSIVLDTRLINFVNIDKAAVAGTITDGWRKFVLVCEDNSTVNGADSTSGIAQAAWNINNDPTLMAGHADIETTVNVLIGRYPVITEATVGFNRYKTSSTSTETIGVGSRTFNVGTGLSYKRADLVKATSTSSAANVLIGRVVSYADGNGTHQAPIWSNIRSANDSTDGLGLALNSQLAAPTINVGGTSTFEVGLGLPFRNGTTVSGGDSATGATGTITGASTVSRYRGFETKSTTRFTVAAGNNQVLFTALGPKENTANVFTYLAGDIIYVSEATNPNAYAFRATVDSYNGFTTSSDLAFSLTTAAGVGENPTFSAVGTGMTGQVIDSANDFAIAHHIGRPDRFIRGNNLTYNNAGAGTVDMVITEVGEGLDHATSVMTPFTYWDGTASQVKTFTGVTAVSGALGYLAGDVVQANQVGTGNFMRGTVTSWTPATQTLVLAITAGNPSDGSNAVPNGTNWSISQWADGWVVQGDGRLQFDVVAGADDVRAASSGITSDAWNITGDGVLQVSHAAGGAAVGVTPWAWSITANGALAINVDAATGGSATGSGTHTSWEVDLVDGSTFNLVRVPYWDNNNHYNNATIIGTGMNYITRVEIADETGLALTGLNSGNNQAVSVPTPLVASHGSRVDFNATYLPPTVATRISDTISNFRRIRIITPFGSSYSVPPVTTPNAAEAFTLSATPSMSGSPIIAYSGTYGIAPATAGDVPSYDSQNGLTLARMPLILSGSNFGGVQKIEFLDHNMRVAPGLTLTVDPKNSPVALFNANFDTISIPATWMDNNTTYTAPPETADTSDETSERMRSVRLTMIHGEVLDLPRFEANATYDQ